MFKLATLSMLVVAAASAITPGLEGNATVLLEPEFDVR